MRFPFGTGSEKKHEIEYEKVKKSEKREFATNPHESATEKGREAR
jgi:hypothetical protein